MKSQSDSPKRTCQDSRQVVDNQSNSQELETSGEILDWYFWSLDKTKDENWTAMRQAKAKLLELVRSCKPESKEKAKDGNYYTGYDMGFNAAIDTMEQNINLKFGG